MSTAKPVRMDPERLQHEPKLHIGRAQAGGLGDRLHEQGVTKHGLQNLVENLDETTALVELLAADPEKVKAALARMMAELKPLLPLFAERLVGWKVIEDLGSPLPGDWDPRLFLDGLMVDCVHPDGQEYMKGEDLVAEARKRLAGRGGFSQHELAWFYQNWQDERIPKWFRDAVESGEIYLIATETVLLDPDGDRCVLYLCWDDGQLDWDYYWLDRECWDRHHQFVVPGNSSD